MNTETLSRGVANLFLVVHAATLTRDADDPDSRKDHRARRSFAGHVVAPTARPLRRSCERRQVPGDWVVCRLDGVGVRVDREPLGEKTFVGHFGS